MITPDFLNECCNEMTTVAQKVMNAKIDEKYSINLLPSDFLNSYPIDIMNDLVVWSKKKQGGKFIYVFSVEGGLPPDELLNLFIKARNSEAGKRAFAKPNRESPVLYVGSSNSLVSRIGQHLGHKNESTYSIQLRHWLKLDSIDSIKIDIWQFSEQTSQTVLQAIEDFLWEKLQPMLGKRGGK